MGFILPNKVLAGTFQLKSIGNLETNGANYNRWWYSVGNPTLSGTTLSGAAVSITVDSQTKTVNADSSGNWNHTLSLAEGDHFISLSSSGSTIVFTLTISTDIPANVGAPASSQTPVAGIIEPTIAIGLLGIVLLTFGVRFSRVNHR